MSIGWPTASPTCAPRGSTSSRPKPRMMRGNRIPVDQAIRALEHGILMSDVFWVMHIDEMDIVARPEDHVGYFPTEKEGYPDILALPDLETLRAVPWHERTALVLADFA